MKSSAYRDPHEQEAMRVARKANRVRQRQSMEAADRLIEDSGLSAGYQAAVRSLLRTLAEEPELAARFGYQAAKAEPDSVFCLRVGCGAMQSAGRLADAEPFIRRALELTPDDPEMLALEIELAEKTRGIRAALELARAARDRFPTNEYFQASCIMLAACLGADGDGRDDGSDADNARRGPASRQRPSPFDPHDFDADEEPDSTGEDAEFDPEDSADRDAESSGDDESEFRRDLQRQLAAGSRAPIVHSVWATYVEDFDPVAAIAHRYIAADVAKPDPDHLQELNDSIRARGPFPLNRMLSGLLSLRRVSSSWWILPFLFMAAEALARRIPALEPVWPWIRIPLVAFTLLTILPRELFTLLFLMHPSGPRAIAPGPKRRAFVAGVLLMGCPLGLLPALKPDVPWLTAASILIGYGCMTSSVGMLLLVHAGRSWLRPIALIAVGVNLLCHVTPLLLLSPFNVFLPKDQAIALSDQCLTWTRWTVWISALAALFAHFQEDD